MGENQLAVVEHGRRPDLMLKRAGGTVSRQTWSLDILEGCRPLAELLDQAHGTTHYTCALEEQRCKVDDPALTPSARMLDIMSTQSIPFFRFAMNQSIAHKGFFDEHPLLPDVLAGYQAQAQESLAEQARQEAADDQPFDEFLKRYLTVD
jgi:glutamate--cysteine ligase